MAKPEELSKFYTDLEQEIINKAALDETEDFRENIFTQIYIDYLVKRQKLRMVMFASMKAAALRLMDTASQKMKVI